MADRSGSARELVFCHSCENEWYRDEHGLVCPDCDSDVVEIIEPSSDPRVDPGFDAMADRPVEREAQAQTLRNHYPWQPHEAPDPDEGDIDDVRFSGPGLRFSHTTFVTGPGGYRSQHTDTGNIRAADVFPQLLGTLFGGQQNPAQRAFMPPGRPDGTQTYRPENVPGAGAPQSPLQEGPFAGRSPPRVRGGVHITTTGIGRQTTHQTIPADDLMGIFSSILNGVGGGGGGPLNSHPTGGHGVPPHPFGFLAQLFDPGNARSGDAVYTNEALDRIISQLMEQHTTSTAPGPASDGAIAALPKIKLTKEQVGDGAAECSICMETCELGEEVTELPCKHWFHGECVAAWLREHDTCPQCRRGIMPKEGDSNVPRQTGQEPRFWQMPPQPESAPTSPAAAGSSGAGGSGGGRPRSHGADAGAEESSSTRGRRNSQNYVASGLGSSIAGWMGRLRPRNSRSGGAAEGPQGGSEPSP